MKEKEFNIPIAGLKDKVYHFEYELEDSFFDTVDEPLVIKPEIGVNLKFDKTNEPYVLDFEISGSYNGECDRCASKIDIPINGSFRLFVEFGEPEEKSDETEVMFISREEQEIRLYDHIHDYVLLSLPMVKRCESPEDIIRCDEIVEAFLSNLADRNVESDPRWEALKKLKKQDDGTS